MATETPSNPEEQPILEEIAKLIEEAKKWVNEAIVKLFSFYSWWDGKDINWWNPWN